MVTPGWSLNHGKLRAMEDLRDVLLIQERLLSDLKESMTPLERLLRDGRGTEYLEGGHVQSVTGKTLPASGGCSTPRSRDDVDTLGL